MGGEGGSVEERGEILVCEQVQNFCMYNIITLVHTLSGHPEQGMHPCVIQVHVQLGNTVMV